MALTAEEVFIAGSGHVYVGEVGATAPTDTTTPWGGDWTELGYTTDAGVVVTPSKTIKPIPAWQARLPVRLIVTDESLAAVFSLLQWNADTIAFYFGGGSWSGSVYSPPAPGDIDERALGVELIDGDKTARLIVPRGMASPGGGVQMIKTDANPLPISFGLLGTDDDSDPYTIIADWVTEFTSA